MKTVIKYFLSTCVFLLSLHSLYAHSNQNFIPSYSTSASSKIYSIQSDFPISLTSISSGTEKENDDLGPLFDDDDDDDFFRKHLENNNQVTAFLCAQPFNGFLNSNHKITSFNNSLSFTSSCRYIAFQTFRI